MVVYQREHSTSCRGGTSLGALPEKSGNCREFISHNTSFLPIVDRKSRSILVNTLAYTLKKRIGGCFLEDLRD